MNEAIKMQLSAFVDGELPENEAELLLRRLSQDAELRQQISEYLAIGRVMRGEPQVSGIDTLRDRIAVALEDPDYPLEMGDEVSPPRNRMIRPLTGIAVAASVALIAVFGLGQVGIDETTVEPTGVAVTEPNVDDVLEEMRRTHELTASPEAIDTRLTGFDVPEAAASTEPEDEEDDVDDAEDPAIDTPAE